MIVFNPYLTYWWKGPLSDDVCRLFVASEACMETTNQRENLWQCWNCGSGLPDGVLWSYHKLKMADTIMENIGFCHKCQKLQKIKMM